MAFPASVMTPMQQMMLARLVQQYPAPGAAPAQPMAQPMQQASAQSVPQTPGYSMIDQRTGKPFSFESPAPASSTVGAPTGIDPNTGQPYGGGDQSAVSGPTGERRGGIEGGNFTNYGGNLSTLGSLAGAFLGPVGLGLGTAGNAIGTTMDLQQAKAIANNFGVNPEEMDPVSAGLNNTSIGGLFGIGNSFGSQLMDLIDKQNNETAAQINSGGMGPGPGGTGGSGPSPGSGSPGDMADQGYSRGGLVTPNHLYPMALSPAGYTHGGVVTQSGLRGPNPPGPDTGYGALKPGEHVLTQAQWARLPKVDKKKTARK